MTTSLEEEPVGDDEILMRRVWPDETTRDQPDGPIRPSSQAFIQDGKDGDASAYLRSETTAERILEGHPEMYVAEVKASDVRAEGLDVQRDPIEGDPGHCNIKGRKTTGRAREIARKSIWTTNHGPTDK